MRDARRAIDLIARIASERTRVRKAKRTSTPTFAPSDQQGDDQWAEGGLGEIMQAAIWPMLQEGTYFGDEITGRTWDLKRDFPPEEAAMVARVGKPRPTEQSWSQIPEALNLDLDNQGAVGVPSGV